ncbi:hypothetical protein AMV117 [Betaentomopoxvirus amoorei]|uniref:AMV117 n=1 Tax=Amsacta moorei entomopoxvirus TaxID=28321 RepID=Q9EMT2_AMEPV|nr:hypothetical protein AMV117 [Amsacta moorei entomopoxvirus]AAG02823.1 AMV117 [Amsacta moorei entomopoxvirus]
MFINDSFHYNINKFKYSYHIKKMKNKIIINEFIDSVDELKSNIGKDLIYLEQYIILLKKSINKILPYIYFSHVKNIIDLKLNNIIYLIKFNNNIAKYNKKYLIIEIKKILNNLNKYYI